MITFPNIGYLGRLGNQMFQFASTVGIAKKLGYEARFPAENCFLWKPFGPPSPLIGGNENIKCDLLEVFNIPEEYFIDKKDLKIEYLYEEPRFEFCPEALSLPNNCGINGYFQTEKYFSNYRNDILSLFSFKSPYKDTSMNYIENIRSEESKSVIVSIHVRRGDYLMYPDHHPVCSSEYYKKSILKIKEEFEKVKFLIFSDDLEWCRRQFREEEYKVVDLGNPYTEISLMSLCDHHIIANSSFSWWGAWLNQSPEKKVIAPKNWFGTAINKNTKDVYCDGWIKN